MDAESRSTAQKPEPEEVKEERTGVSRCTSGKKGTTAITTICSVIINRLHTAFT
jgi:hypothetical protein